MTQTLYSWNFSDEKNRGKFWYIIAFSVVIGLSLWGFLTKQYGMSFIVLLISGLVYFVENNSDENIQVEIKDLGIKISEAFYDYTKINSYTYVYNGEEALYLRLFLKKQGLKAIDLKVNNQIVSELQNILPSYLEENEKQDISLSEQLIKTLKL